MKNFETQDQVLTMLFGEDLIEGLIAKGDIVDQVDTEVAPFMAAMLRIFKKDAANSPRYKEMMNEAKKHGIKDEADKMAIGFAAFFADLTEDKMISVGLLPPKGQ